MFSNRGKKLIKSLKIELIDSAKSPLSPLCQRGVFSLPSEKGGEEGFYKTKSLNVGDDHVRT
jgi:hypothetical protein